MTQTVPLTCSRVLGNFFVLFVLSVIGSLFYNFVSEFYPRRHEPSIFILLAVNYFLLFMILWCFFKAMLTDPGVAPPLWGFYMGDSEQKRRRYCLMCHVFKPERCHHCSACNRCVLNMDHHCPWINNCVGFYNRKYFLLLLVYVILGTSTISVVMAKSIWTELVGLVESRDVHNYHSAVKIGLYMLNLMLTIILSLFFKFHLRLLFTNKTTIETMDKKNERVRSPYDRGWKFNFMQVFGRNPWLWLLPITGVSGKPLGDGVVWHTVEENRGSQEMTRPLNQQISPPVQGTRQSTFN